MFRFCWVSFVLKVHCVPCSVAWGNASVSVHWKHTWDHQLKENIEKISHSHLSWLLNSPWFNKHLRGHGGPKSLDQSLAFLSQLGVLSCVVNMFLYSTDGFITKSAPEIQHESWEEAYTSTPTAYHSAKRLRCDAPGRSKSFSVVCSFFTMGQYRQWMALVVLTCSTSENKFLMLVRSSLIYMYWIETDMIAGILRHKQLPTDGCRLASLAGW